MKPRLFWGVAGLVIVVGGYLLIHDDPLSAQSKTLLERVSPETSDSKAYLLLMGLDSRGSVEDAVALGKQRLAAYETWLADQPAREALGEYKVTPPFKPRATSELFCDIDSAGCFERMFANGDQVDRLWTKDFPLLDLYRSLIATADYRTLSSS